MPPHVARPARLFASTLEVQLRRLRSEPAEVACTGGESHRIVLVGRTLEAEAHDEEAEAVLRAVGGAEPPCVRIVQAAAEATTPDWWAALRDREGPLASLPAPHLHVLLARALHDEFADASAVVQDSVAQLGLALLGDAPPAAARLQTKYAMTRELPHWDPGPGPWSDKELVLLARCMRAAPGEPRPHLAHLPADPLARRAVATYLVGLLDAARVLTPQEVRTALAPTFRNVKAVLALLTAEGLVTPVEGGYRVSRRPSRR